ncbi:8-amino-7-oxononanoate synthase [Marinomonas rhizomae]|uniref:8-amino-7-oxononanoate synthase n=1 Tax=Marinomonas rhizomae TaxID=491948 RepID=A0A366J3Z8_9GAMM|nr:8-amino-7-oxononanoate synthase [Marinomonas rhizomae]RBP81763.1 8-amino-7-oxononanoate synthase [Marinomonas rhizomae]RNF72887.1 8-amino-7-oxononanoate synthase [Marinomonas rhizomae]
MKPALNTPDWVLAALQERRQQDLMRSTITLDSPQVPHPQIHSQNYTAFCSNDYLGLANHPKLIKAMNDTAQAYGVGGGSSHLVCGHLAPHQALEEALADWLGYERVMLFSTGYMANLGVISALADKNRPVVQDKLNHASLIDGALLAQAPLRRYLHGNVTSAQKLLSKYSTAGLLITDGVFSMDGDIAPLADLSQLANQHDWMFMVDDAHGLGCLGENGRGCLSLAGLDAASLPILVGTFGKSFGTAGAFVATSHDYAEYLTQFARPYVYTTAMSPAIAGATLASLQLVQSVEGQERRERLARHIAYFRKRVQTLPVTLMPSNTAIQPIVVGDSKAAIKISERLKDLGIWCTAIRPPTVPVGSARLRITLSAAHSDEDLVLLCDSLERVLTANFLNEKR